MYCHFVNRAFPLFSLIPLLSQSDPSCFLSPNRACPQVRHLGRLLVFRRRELLSSPHRVFPGLPERVFGFISASTELTRGLLVRVTTSLLSIGEMILSSVCGCNDSG